MLRKKDPMDIFNQPTERRTDEASETGQKPDMVNHPPHYKRNGVECIDWIRTALSPEEFRGYLKGSILKYFWRHEDKGNPVQDLDKMGWFNDALKELIIGKKDGETDILPKSPNCDPELIAEDMLLDLCGMKPSEVIVETDGITVKYKAGKECKC